MITINSVSGGKTSAYIAANYDSDYNLFSLVTTESEECRFKDESLRQKVSDRIGKEFIGTLEDDIIIHTIFDLEQYIGKEIVWVSGISFDEVIKTKGGWLPNKLHRYCTTHLKLEPMFEWWRENFDEPVQFRIGFRANEQGRAKRTLEKRNKDGYLEYKAVVGKYGTRKKWGNIPWQIPTFPLIEDQIYKDNIEKFWKDKPVRFAWMNNCVGCFHKNPVLLNKMFTKHPNKMKWFADQEQGRKKQDGWITHMRDNDIKNWNLQTELFDTDFTDCDSGYCGI